MTPTASETAPARAPGTVPALVRYLGLLWTICTVRKAATCFRTGADIPAGSRAYRPLTNGKLRMLRMLPNVVIGRKAGKGEW